MALNVTAADPRQPGFLTVHQVFGAPPRTSTVNFPAGQSIANSAIAKVNPDGTVVIYSMAWTHIVVDVTGWWE